MRNRPLRALALATLGAVGLSGCLKLDMQLDLQPDDTVDGSMVVAISNELADLAGEDPGALAEQLVQDMDLTDVENARTEPYDDGDYVGSTLYFEDEPLDSFGSGGTEDELRIVREGDEYVVTGVLDLSEGAEAGTMFGMGDTFDVRIGVSFPGDVAEHNGTLDGRTVTWEPQIGERLEINARGSAVEGGPAALPLPLPVLIAIGVVALVGIGLVIFFVLRSRRNDGPAVAAPGGYPPGYGSESAYGTAQAPAPGQPGYDAMQGPAAAEPSAPSGEGAPPAAGAEHQPGEADRPVPERPADAPPTVQPPPPPVPGQGEPLPPRPEGTDVAPEREDRI